MIAENIKTAICQAVENEPFARLLNIEIVELDLGRSVVEMTYNPDAMDNIYKRAHGGAIFGLIDEAFETAAQTDGTIAVAINVNVTYVNSPKPGVRLRAEAHRISNENETAGYSINVSDNHGNMIATCHALAFRTGKPIPFI